MPWWELLLLRKSQWQNIVNDSNVILIRLLLCKCWWNYKHHPVFFHPICHYYYSKCTHWNSACWKCSQLNLKHWWWECRMHSFAHFSHVVLRLQENHFFARCNAQLTCRQFHGCCCLQSAPPEWRCHMGGEQGTTVQNANSFCVCGWEWGSLWSWLSAQGAG